MSPTEKGKKPATGSSLLPAALGPLASLPRLLTLSVVTISATWQALFI